MAATASIAPANIQLSPHPLRERNFRLLWTGSTISLLGDQFYLVALPWVVLQLTGSAVAMGTILMAAAIPRAVLMLVGGAVTDQVSPRKVMMSTATARTIFVAAIGALLWLGTLRIWELYVLGFAFGVADAFAMPAASSYLPTLVKREQMVQANSVVQTTAQLTTIAGPTPAAIVIKAFGTAWAFFLDAISFLFILAALVRLPDPPRRAAGSSRPRVWRSILDGITAVRNDVPLRTLMLLVAMLNICTSGPVAIGLPYLAKTRFGSPAAYATLISAVAAGGLLGALLAGIWRTRRRGLLLLMACVVLGICFGSIGLLNQVWLIAAVLLLMGVSAGLTNVQIVSWIQQRVAPTVRGRVMSVVMLAAFGLFPLSLAASGFLVAWSLKGTFLLAGAALVMITGVGACQRQVREIQ